MGTAYCLYIYCVFQRRLCGDEDCGKALLNTYSRTTLATLTAVGTTIAGLASLVVTPIEAVRQFSAFACMGVAAMLVAVMTVLPCLLVFARPLIGSQRPDAVGRLFSAQRAGRLVRWIIAWRRPVFIALACFALVAVAGIARIRIYLMFLSVKVGLIAMAANLFPVLVSFGAMGWLGIELSMGTCLIASIVLGLAVDDSIHYLARYRRAYLRSMDAQAAMCMTLTQVGPPIAATSLAISAGFSILMFSNFLPTALFGVLMMLAMASALSGGLVILPAMLSRVSPITLEEMFRVRTGGEDLQNTVPLLKGMSRYQIHRVFKTGTIRRIQAGDYLFDEGDVADRLYVVISGMFDAVMAGSSPGSEKRRTLHKRVNRLEVGDIIGEMGLLTSGLRCVSVFAVVSGEVLALEQSHLERIRRLYPRTASRFFANLSTILTRKLIHADTCLYNTCHIDDDTGLLNRSAFLDRLETEIQKAHRFGDTVTVCLLYIAGLEKLATTDPLSAERVIGTTAGAVLACFRSIDVLGRFDKGHLAVLLTRATGAGKRSIRDRLVRAFNGCYTDGHQAVTRISCCFIDLDACRVRGQVTTPIDPDHVIRAGLRGNDHHQVYPAIESPGIHTP